MSDWSRQYEISAKLNAARMLAGLTYKDVQRMTGIPIGTLANYMKGTHFPDNARLRVLANAVGVSEEELFEEVKQW